MNTFFYIIIFIIGTLFGSFYTLAVYRIPKRQDIVHTHSYCPNCNHKLGLLDLFPIFSYILLGGKCRYCKQKIRPRYLILESLTGVLFVIIAFLMGMRIDNLNVKIITEFCFIVLYLTYIILMSGINKENKTIDKYVNIYGIVISLSYMVYLYIIGKASIYRYGIYIILYAILLIANWKFKDNKKEINQILIAIITMTIFTGEYLILNTILITIIISSIILAKKRAKKEEKNENTSRKVNLIKELPTGFLLGVSNVSLLVCILAYNNFIL